MAELFYSYSHADETFRDRLEKHFTLLKRQGYVTSWHDRKIIAGREIDFEISANLNSADIILLLVSADFLASDYCYEKEMNRAIERHNDGSAVVIPVIVHPCQWHTAPFGRLRATPTDGKPISTFSNPEEAFDIVAQDIKAAVESLEPSPEYEQRKSKGRSVLTSTPAGRRRPCIKRKFDDHERDEFLDEAFECIVRHFEASLNQMAREYPHIKTRFKRIDATRFTVVLYQDGSRSSECAVRIGTGIGREHSIVYSASADASNNSFNESVRVEDDGFALHLKPMGMPMYGNTEELCLSSEAAARYYWDLLLRPLTQ